MYRNNNNILITSLMFAVVFIALSYNATAFASIQSATNAMRVISATCPTVPSQSDELTRLKQDIATARNIELARKMALAPTDDALNALKNARHLMPFSADLEVAENRLETARNRIMLASSQDQVADEFDGMMLAGLDNDRAAHVNIGSGSCNYSTGELIAVAIGLILGIIPGLILLVVLC